MIFLARSESTAWYAQWFSGTSGNLSGGFCACAEAVQIRQREAPRKVTAFLMLLPPSTVGVSAAKTGDCLRAYSETISVSRRAHARQQAFQSYLDCRKVQPYS